MKCHFDFPTFLKKYSLIPSLVLQNIDLNSRTLPDFEVAVHSLDLQSDLIFISFLFAINHIEEKKKSQYTRNL